MLARVSEDPVLAILYLAYLACAVAAIRKLAFGISCLKGIPMNSAAPPFLPVIWTNRILSRVDILRYAKGHGGYDEGYYLPMKTIERVYIVITLVAALALFAASLSGGRTPGSSLGIIFFIPVLRPSARLLYYVNDEPYYCDDWFTVNAKIENLKCVREGKHAVVIFHITGKKKQGLIQFNIPAEDACFFEGTA
ncbi:MAG: hypothetical protein LBL26_09745 [Peptococcaceae bacterium]|nr:hypothetical protein [Peptococcaceae bacterium]